MDYTITIKEGMWGDCIDYAIKASAHCRLLEGYNAEPSEANKATLREWDKKLRDKLVGLSIKYKCNSYVLSDLINMIISLSTLIPFTELEKYDPVGSIYKMDRFRNLFYVNKEG